MHRSIIRPIFVKQKTKTMKITATNNDFGIVVFTWNADLTECGYTAIDVDDATVSELIDANVHEGKDLDGWKIILA